MNTSENKIDLTAIPHLPQGFRESEDFMVETHIGKGTWEYDLAKIGIFISEKQTETDETSITGKELYEEVKNLPVMPANIMIWLWQNPEKAIEFLKAVYEKYGLEDSTCVFFWGTEYKDDGHGVVVFCMSLFKGTVYYQRGQLSRRFSRNFPALIMLE